MKANLPQNEPKMLSRWEEMRIYDLIRESRKGAPLYVLHDGPPYANGPIHLGTAINKCLKDFIVKSKTMAGFDAPYIPGWDCHGLPIEIKVDESLGGKKLQMDPLTVRKICREFAQKYLDLQRKQFKRIGVFGRFDDPYSTMNPQYEAAVVSALYSFFEKDAIYKGLRPVYWCIHDMTALAEAEVEYENHTSPSIWVKYRLQSDPRDIDSRLADERIHLGKEINTIIWTTTPWTLPASMAVAFHPDEEYVALATNDAIYIVAEKLAKVTAENCGFTDYKEIARFPGRKLEHAYFYHPFLPWEERKIVGVLAEYVTMDQGTGAVHTAPSHGADDFYTGVKYKLDQTCNVDAAGRLVQGLPEYQGETVFKANPKIVELLKSRNVLLHYEKIEHSYPHCWRCHNPVIFRATEQWFISMESNMDGKGTTLRQRSLEETRKVKWDPAWGEERIGNMFATRPDWCISRQRVWGVPIAVFFCKGCKHILNNPEVHKAVVDMFAKEGADSWYRTPAESILPAGTKCPKCGDAKFEKEMDIIDVWFESGSSYLSVQSNEAGFPWPADMYLEGGDQYRGWFHSSMLCAIGAKNSSPYKGVITHGWTLDDQGRAQSKSIGNTTDPVEVAEKMGGEIVRLWASSVDFREDVVGSETLMQRVAENYRKIRNTFRYILGNLNEFDPSKHAVPFAEMEEIDRYILLRTAELSREVRKWYEQFQFHKVYQLLLTFSSVDLSAVYFDILKDRLYTSAPNGKPRRSGQTALWKIGETLVRLAAPIMSFTAEEFWQFLPPVSDRPKSVHITKFMDEAELAGTADAQLIADWQTLLRTRDDVLKALEEARNNKQIGSGLEAKVVLDVPASIYPVLEQHASQLRYIYIVSAVELGKSAETNGTGTVKVTVERAPGQKCERCWNYSTHVGEYTPYPTVCERCAAVLPEFESAAGAS
ncbi:MAG TPA: isoleucine--tRNA ligase [Terriglobales bacterium]|nr:isoleucine--tRNA ligase [Terriglobales bacterium]